MFVSDGKTYQYWVSSSFVRYDGIEHWSESLHTNNINKALAEMTRLLTLPNIGEVTIWYHGLHTDDAVGIKSTRVSSGVVVPK
jgi:hypothetical protein